MEWTITEGERPKICMTCKGSAFIQDCDTFDTWFSSAQWPYATLETSGSNDFKYFYPTSIMETAYDILPFWVIRMIMLGIFETGEVPFKTVVLHGMVRDKEGQKISKSIGNVINPLEMIEKYGADALRMGLIWGTLTENDISLSEDNIRGQRNFANKIWNVARFILADKENNLSKATQRKIAPKSISKADREIVSKLKVTARKATKLIEKYKFNEAAKELYDFIWNQFANSYLEENKIRKAKCQNTLEFVLQESLKMLHPFMPFVTESIWQIGFAKDGRDMLIFARWPR
jgi:valyl-tRNA synthetase